MPPPNKLGRPRKHPWREILNAIVRQQVRTQLGRDPHPSAGVIDSQWVKTTSWLGQNRRLSKYYERLTDTSEAMIYTAMTRLMVRRLAQTC